MILAHQGLFVLNIHGVKTDGDTACLPVAPPVVKPLVRLSPLSGRGAVGCWSLGCCTYPLWFGGWFWEEVPRKLKVTDVC